MGLSLDFSGGLRKTIYLGPILHRLRDIAVFCVHDPILIPPQFLGVPVGPDRNVGVNVSRYLKLFGRQIIFAVFQPK